MLEAVNALDYQWYPVNWFFLLSPPHSSSSGGDLTAVYQGNSGLSVVDRSSMVASVGHTENKIGCTPSTTSSYLPQVSQGEHGGTPQNGSTIYSSYKSIQKSSSGNSEILDQEDL